MDRSKKRRADKQMVLRLNKKIKMTLFYAIPLFILILSVLAFSAYARGQGRSGGMNINTPVTQSVMKVQDDPDFFLNVTFTGPPPVLRVNLSIQSNTSETEIVGFYNITCGNYDCTKFQDKLVGLECSGTFCSKLIRIDQTNSSRYEYWEDIGFPFPNKNQFILMQFGNTTATVNITTVGNFYNVTSGDNSSLNNPWFSASFRNDNVPSISHAVGGLSEYSIFGTFFPRRLADGDTTPNENVGLANSTHFATSDTALTNANMSIVERGPVRVMLQATNRTSNTCNGFIENSCINWTSESYSYPRQIFIFNTFSGNYTNMSFLSWEALEQQLDFQFNYSTNLSLEGVVNHTSILNFIAGQFRRGNSRASLNMFFNTTNGNRTLLIFPSRFLNSSNDVRWKINIPATAPTSVITFYLGDNVISNADITERAVEFGYGILFGRNGARAETESATVYGLDFNESYRAFRFPFTIGITNGTYEGRDNKSGTYNLTPPTGSNVVRFNVSTNFDNHTYPVVHLRNLAVGFVNNSSYYRNFSANNSWIRLTNGTDFLVQGGNDSFFGYNYTLIQIYNGILGNNTNQTYEYRFANNTTEQVFYSFEPDNDTATIFAGDKIHSFNVSVNATTDPSFTTIDTIIIELEDPTNATTNYTATRISGSAISGKYQTNRTGLVEGVYRFRWFSNNTVNEGNISAGSRELTYKVVAPGATGTGGGAPPSGPSPEPEPEPEAEEERPPQVGVSIFNVPIINLFIIALLSLIVFYGWFVRRKKRRSRIEEV